MKRSSLFSEMQVVATSLPPAVPLQTTMMVQSESTGEPVNDNSKYCDRMNRGVDHEGTLKSG